MSNLPVMKITLSKNHLLLLSILSVVTKVNPQLFPFRSKISLSSSLTHPTIQDKQSSRNGTTSSAPQTSKNNNSNQPTNSIFSPPTNSYHQINCSSLPSPAKSLFKYNRIQQPQLDYHHHQIDLTFFCSLALQESYTHKRRENTIR